MPVPTHTKNDELHEMGCRVTPEKADLTDISVVMSYASNDSSYN